MKKIITLTITFLILLNASSWAFDLAINDISLSSCIEANRSMLTDCFSLSNISVEAVKAVMGNNGRTNLFAKNSKSSSKTQAPAGTAQNKKPSKDYYFSSNIEIRDMLTKTMDLKSRLADYIVRLQDIRTQASRPGYLHQAGGDISSLLILLMFILFFYSRPRGALEAALITILNTVKIQSAPNDWIFYFKTGENYD